MIDAKLAKAAMQAETEYRHVAKPDLSYYCWAQKRVYIGQRFPSWVPCSKRARPGYLTCAHHKAWEADAQEEREQEQLKPAGGEVVNAGACKASTAGSTPARQSKPRIPVICLECRKKFWVRVYANECPRCGGTDIDVRE